MKVDRSKNIERSFAFRFSRRMRSLFAPSPSRRRSHRRYGIAIVAIMKNEGPYICEWIEFHLAAGVEHFYIFDNESTDDTIEILRRYERRKVVTIIKIAGVRVQIKAYNKALRRFGKQARYLAFIDADEFLFPLKGSLVSSLDDLSNRYKDLGGLCVPWVTYGSSGHICKPEGGVVETYCMRAKEASRFCKTIVIPERAFRFTNPHFAWYLRGYSARLENGSLVPTGWVGLDRPLEPATIRLNHYVTKSRDEWIKRKTRGGGFSIQHPDLSLFEALDLNEVYDPAALIYLNGYKKRRMWTLKR